MVVFQCELWIGPSTRGILDHYSLENRDRRPRIQRLCVSSALSSLPIVDFESSKAIRQFTQNRLNDRAEYSTSTPVVDHHYHLKRHTLTFAKQINGSED